MEKVHKNQFFSNIFTFLSVTRQNFEYNLRILANFRNFHVKTQNLRITLIHFQKLHFFVFFNEDYTFYTKNLFIRLKIAFKAFFTTKDAKSFVKIIS